MASFFRNRIAQKVISACRGVIFNTCDEIDREKISRFITVSRERVNHPQMILPVSRMLQKLPSEGDVSTNTTQILQAIRNQGLPSAEGITDVELITSHLPEHFVFTIDKHVFTRIVLLSICDDIHRIPETSCLFRDIPKETVLLNFSSPAIGSKYNLGNFRALAIFNFVSNIYEFIGHKVIRINHIEDWGPKRDLLLAGCYHSNLENISEGNVIDYLFQIYEALLLRLKADDSFRQTVLSVTQDFQNGHPTLVRRWTDWRNRWKKELNSHYKNVDIEFDEVLCDSQYHQEINKVSDFLLEKDLPSSISMNQNVSKDIQWTPLPFDVDVSMYSLARKVSSAIHCKKSNEFCKIYYVSENNDSHYYEDLYQVVKNMGYDWHSDISHIAVQGIDYSTKRKSQNFYSTLHHLKTHFLTQLQDSISFNFEGDKDKLADKLSVASLLVDILQTKRKNTHTFDFDTLTEYSLNLGTSFQLCYASLNELFGETGTESLNNILQQKILDLSPLAEPQVLSLVQHLARFDEMVLKAYTYYEPYLLVQYTYSLCYFVEKCRDALEIDEKKHKMRVNKARLVLIYSTKVILGSCLKLLGVQPLEELK